LFSTYIAGVNASTENIILDLDGKVMPSVQQGIPGLQALYVFGSTAERRLRADSDIDLAVLATDMVDPEILFSVAQACARLVGREVELVDLRAVPVVFQAQIVGRGRRLGVPNRTHEADFFENQVLSRYAAFVEERRPVVSEIVKRRAIHAA
jgi:predicted nucleotidyltransferase